ncbi:hypothetical protein ACFV6F_28550 [Kitasatospora phosalacinea]|uniref:hypothetical protein n=1 Tax=Kitasatospora phosalacinea TaxID=2065 RepID=UPI00365AC4BC
MPATHLITGTARSGKTRAVEQLVAVEKLTHGPAVTVWGIETATPGRLTGLDRAADTDQAVQLLTEAAAIAGRRLAHANDYKPSTIEPRLLLVVDGAEPLLADTEAAGLLQFLAVVGRKSGVETVLTAADTRLDAWPPTLHCRFHNGPVTTLPDRTPTQD